MLRKNQKIFFTTIFLENFLSSSLFTQRKNVNYFFFIFLIRFSIRISKNLYTFPSEAKRALRNTIQDKKSETLSERDPKVN